MNTVTAITTQVRRELWEHRGLLAYTPFVIAAVLLALAIGGVGFGVGQFSALVEGDLDDLIPGAGVSARELPPELLRAVMLLTMTMSLTLFVAVLVVMIFFYSLDALYAERRDRSILFWRSLPVSDLRTVLCKLVTAVLVAPLLVVAAIMVVQVGSLLIAMAGAAFTTGGPSPGELWRATPLASLWVLQVYGALAMTLWWSPLLAWLLLASAWAPKAPLVWGVLPPIALGLIERMTVGTSWVFSALGERVIGFAPRAFEFDARRVFGMAGDGDSVDFSIGAGSVLGQPGNGAAVESGLNVLALATPGQLLAAPGLWGGLVVAAVLVAGAVYVRRFRGES